jgi:hypothetical protein
MSLGVNLSYTANHSLHGITVPSAVATGRHYFTCPVLMKGQGVTSS